LALSVASKPAIDQVCPHLLPQARWVMVCFLRGLGEQ